MPPVEPNDEEELEKIAEDEDLPFSPPADPGPATTSDSDDASMADDTHPDTDDGMEDQEVYDAGISAASGSSEPNAGNTVTGYDPTKDHRKAA